MPVQPLQPTRIEQNGRGNSIDLLGQARRNRLEPFSQHTGSTDLPSGHFLRVLTARWLGLEPAAGKYFQLSTASLSVLGFDHNQSEPVVRLWNEIPQVRT